MNLSAASLWHGIIPPLLTPLSDRDTLDHPGLEKLLDHLLAGGVHGLSLRACRQSGKVRA
jgi:dihydrodipicolinate synthase/N-acetylneuraminate lyase